MAEPCPHGALGFCPMCASHPRTAEAAPPPACVHGAPPGRCAFGGCSHFRPDGPRDERWAFRPGTTQEDIAEALAESALVHARAPGSASPIHMVVDAVVRRRLEREGKDR
jgi:hypothetical protein